MKHAPDALRMIEGRHFRSCSDDYDLEADEQSGCPQRQRSSCCPVVWALAQKSEQYSFPPSRTSPSSHLHPRCSQAMKPPVLSSLMVLLK